MAWLYWRKQLKSEDTDTSQQSAVTFHHEGFFWRCWFNETKTDDSMWKFWFANQPPKKSCMHAYLFPFPVDTEVHNNTARETAVLYRGFWTVFMILGVVAIVTAGFLIICAAPFASHRLYKAGGGLFITAGILFAILVVMYVIWVQSLADMETYIQLQKTHRCSSFTIQIRYGWSFILAPIGIFFSLFSGMLFLLVGRVIQLHTK
ncbi:transmembrane protein 182 isoform X2 [Protopterus annectens]|uniref:transmembrane protein 182 isoform X2 n=1 Tax=Protopterus annectens TaxID=7888 RepID=UPI001CF9CED5|nr:transmembrane protein 182 isoform X2 [Protopterus annectens]